MHPVLCPGPGVPLYPSCRHFFGSTAPAGMEQEKPAHTEPAAGLFLSLGSLRPVQIPTHFLASKEIIAAVSNSPHLLISLFLSALTPKPLLLFFFSLLEFTNTCCSYLLLASLNSVAVFCGRLHPSPVGHGLFVSARRAGGSLVQSCFRQLLSVKLFLPGCCDRAPEAGRVSVLSGTKNTS